MHGRHLSGLETECIIKTPDSHANQKNVLSWKRCWRLFNLMTKTCIVLAINLLEKVSTDAERRNKF